MPIETDHPAHALAQALTGPPLSAPFTRLDALRRLAALCDTPAVDAALRSAATHDAEIDGLVAALRVLTLDAGPALQPWDRAQAAPPQAVAIILQGGVVQEVCSATALPHLRFETIDYDVDRSDVPEAEQVPFKDGSKVAAWRHGEPVTSPSDIDWVRFDADAA